MIAPCDKVLVGSLIKVSVLVYSSVVVTRLALTSCIFLLRGVTSARGDELLMLTESGAVIGIGPRAEPGWSVRGKDCFVSYKRQKDFLGYVLGFFFFGQQLRYKF